MESRPGIRPADRPHPEARALPAPGSLPPAFLGRDPGVMRVLETAHRLARSDMAVLLVGETGTGKEVVARTIHHASPRSRGPFRALNCASLPPGILEGELFGAVRGAYTGATEPRPGLLEASHGGTLFLDEIGDMPAALQASLLRVLEDGMTRRLGDTEERRVDFRIVAATNRDLDRLVGEGRFRADLLYRLGRVLRLPPLRQRGEDVLLLARAFLAEAAGGRVPGALDPGAEAWLLSHPFPGNVRELRSRILAAVALSEDGVVRARDLADEEVPAGEAVARGVDLPGRNGSQDRLLDALRRLEIAPVARLVDETGLPRRTVQRALADLVREGGLLREGRGPATRYCLRRGGQPPPGPG